MADLATARRAELIQDLFPRMHRAKKNVLSYSILFRVGRFLRLPDSKAGDGASAFVVSLLIWLVLWIVNRIAGVKISWQDAMTLFIPAVFTGVCLLLVKAVEEDIFVHNMVSLSEMPADEEGYQAMAKELSLIFRKVPQVIFALFFGCVGLLTAIYLCLGFPNLAKNVGFFIGIFLASASIGIGAYFAILLPILIRTVASHRVCLFPYNPAQSKIVSVGMSITSGLTLGTGIAAALIMILLLVTNPWGKQTTFWIALAWLIFIWGLTTYTFAVPFSAMSKAIVREKMAQMERLSRLVDQYDSRIGELNNDELEKLQQLINMRRDIFNSKNTPVETSSLKDYITSLILPTLSFAIGSYDTLAELVKDLL